jgi:AraC-like DNA-binding protein
MVEYQLPSPALREYVRQMQLIHFDFTSQLNVPYKPYWPRPENCLTFYPRDSETITYPGSTTQLTKSRSVLVGQATMLTNRFMGRNFMVLQVIFQPGALFRLTGIPMYELTDTFVDAESIFSTEVQRVNDRLNSTEGFTEMISILETFLHQLIRKSKKEFLPIDRLSQLMLLSERQNLDHLNPSKSSCPQSWSVDWMAREACLSSKQFYRKSMERLGVSPKLFGRLVRFNQAAKFRLENPTVDWLVIAVENGYYDYQHLSRDFKTFTQLAPNNFLKKESQAAPCAFGLLET